MLDKKEFKENLKKFADATEQLAAFLECLSGKEMPIKPGNVVTLKQGSNLMTVERVFDDETAQCISYSDGDFVQKKYDLDDLEHPSVDFLMTILLARG